MPKMTPVTFSEQAIKEIKQIFEGKKVPEGYCLRVTVNGGGCAGVEHKLGFDQKTEFDLIYNDFGFDVIIAKKDLMHLIGKHVSFLEDTDKRGFVFEDQTS